MATVKEVVRQNCPDLKPLEELYKSLHQNPELSYLERETSAAIVDQLTKINGDYDIKSQIGGYGIAAVLKNGEGPKVLLRADFEALPIEEQTGLDYASTKRMKTRQAKNAL